MNRAIFLVPVLVYTSAAFAEARGVDAVGFSPGLTCGGAVTVAMTGAGPASAR